MIVIIAKEDNILFKLIDNSLNIDLFAKENYINLNYTDNNPYISTQVLYNAQDVYRAKL